MLTPYGRRTSERASVSAVRADVPPWIRIDGFGPTLFASCSEDRAELPGAIPNLIFGVT